MEYHSMYISVVLIGENIHCIMSVASCPLQIIESFISDVYLSRHGTTISEEKLEFLWSLAVSIFAIGGMIGGFSGAYIADRFGR